MKAQWEELVLASGLAPMQTSVAARVPAPTGSELTLYDNGPLAIIEATGKDAGTFLQSQSCNDLLKLPADRAQISGYCTPKGRLLALFTVFAVDHSPAAVYGDASAGTAPAFRIVVPAGILDGFLKRLRMFVMRADVTFTEREDLVCVGLSCEPDTDLVEHVAGALGVGSSTGDAATLRPLLDTAEPMALTTLASGCSVLRWPDSAASSQRRHLLIGPTDALIGLWKALASTATLANHAAWRLADIGAGLPRVEPGTLETFVPQMVNLHLINALSFTKGCYPGQEIVARMHYLGKLKRHMRRFRLVAADAPEVAPGTALTAGTDVNAGEVVDAIRDGEVIELLAVVKVATTDLLIGSATLEALELPYALPTQGDDVDAGLPPVEGVAGAVNR